MERDVRSVQSGSVNSELRIGRLSTEPARVSDRLFDDVGFITGKGGDTIL
jgi:hypothetical protein